MFYVYVFCTFFLFSVFVLGLTQFNFVNSLLMIEKYFLFELREYLADCNFQTYNCNIVLLKCKSGIWKITIPDLFFLSYFVSLPYFM